MVQLFERTLARIAFFAGRNGICDGGWSGICEFLHLGSKSYVVLLERNKRWTGRTLERSREKWWALVNQLLQTRWARIQNKCTVIYSEWQMMARSIRMQVGKMRWWMCDEQMSGKVDKVTTATCSKSACFYTTQIDTRKIVVHWWSTSCRKQQR